MLSKDLTISRAQEKQPWTVPYSDAVVKACDGDIPHILASHAVLHAAKSVGKLAAVFEELDHTGADHLTGEQFKMVQAMSADLLTIALRMANIYTFDLATVLVERVEEKNGVNILEEK